MDRRREQNIFSESFIYLNHAHSMCNTDTRGRQHWTAEQMDLLNTFCLFPLTAIIAFSLRIILSHKDYFIYSLHPCCGEDIISFYGWGNWSSEKLDDLLIVLYHEGRPTSRAMPQLCPSPSHWDLCSSLWESRIGLCLQEITVRLERKGTLTEQKEYNKEIDEDSS